MRITEILKATGGKLVGAGSAKPIAGVSIDSRTIKKGELFLAVRGLKYDGHDFIKAAFEKKARLAIAEFRPAYLAPRMPVIIVRDSITALGDLASHHRRKFNIPVVGITGSNGKTTVKEIAAHILGGRFNVLKNKGTENNFVGLPLTLLRLKPRHDVAVLEMGANHAGEISRLSMILKPTLGLITNIGPSHLGFFGDLGCVLKAKTEILEHLGKNPIILNEDDGLLQRIKPKTKKITFGIVKKSAFQAGNIREGANTLQFSLNKRVKIGLKLSGRHNVYNALAGIAIASVLGMDPKSIQKRIAQFKPLPMRMHVSLINGLSVVDDTYNSNPLSSRCAIEFLSHLKTKGRRIFVTGDMFELGRSTERFHKEIGKLTADSLIDKLITVGKLSEKTGSAARKAGMDASSVWNCASPDRAVSILSSIAQSGDTVLIKGSRAMGMERIIKKLKEIGI